MKKRKRKVSVDHVSRTVRQRQQKKMFTSFEDGDLKGKFDDDEDRKKVHRERGGGK